MRIHLSGYDMAGAGHLSPGLWRHPADQSYRYNDLGYWTSLARTLEDGCFDSLFLADVPAAYDVYRHSAEAAIRNGAQIPANDPVLVVPAMAAVTEHLGFGVTVPCAYQEPHLFARRFSTLDQLTRGRIGWNIVTCPPGGDGATATDRYDVADEFLQVCYKLWESSWEDGAVIRDQRTGVHTDPRKVHPIEHHGKYFSVPGIHLCEPSPQRSPVLFHSGAASPAAQRFAAEHAEVIFVAGPAPDLLRPQVETMRRLAEQAGRDPAGLKFLALMTVITAGSDEHAAAKYQDYLRYASYDGALALYGLQTGIDVSGFGLDEPLRTDEVREAVEGFRRADPDRDWTPREIARWMTVGGLGPVLAGGPETVAGQMEQWAATAGVDGFNLAYAVTPGTFEDVVAYLVPELQRRGLMPARYQGKTLRENLYGTGQPLLRDDHPGSWYRRPAADWSPLARVF